MSIDLGQMAEERWRDVLEQRTTVVICRPGVRKKTARHVFALSFCPVQAVAMRIELVARRLDVDVVSIELGMAWLAMFHHLGWRSFAVSGSYDGGTSWRPGVMTCVGMVKRLVPDIPWWILTPTQLLRHLEKKEKRNEPA